MMKKIQQDRILVADDSLTVRMELEELLKDMGLEVVLAEDGRQCLELLNQEKPDAVLLDVIMPEMDGFEVLKSIKGNLGLRDIPVIMQTSLDDTESIRRGIDEGAFYYLTKPVDVSLLQSIVTAAISDYRQHEALREKIKESDNPFAFVVDATFRFKTLADAEYLALRIANTCPSPTETATAINELMINAVEHGNAGITYEEKGEHIAAGTLQDEIDRRLESPANAHKHVEVRIRKEPDKMTVLIADEGPGFDYEKYLQLDETRALHAHGRGVVLAGLYTDLQYIPPGNKVCVTIPFKKPDE